MGDPDIQDLRENQTGIKHDNSSVSIIQPEEGEVKDKYRYIKPLRGGYKTQYIIPLIRENGLELRNKYFDKEPKLQMRPIMTNKARSTDNPISKKLSRTIQTIKDEVH